MAEITQTIPSITNIPDRINDSPEQFSENAILSLEQQQTFSAAINTFSGQANAVRDEMVALDSNVTSNASTSAANALSASDSADAAAASESNADADALTASNAASAAESSETNAAASASAASNSEIAAASSETNAASSAATAISNASTSTTNAASALASKNAAAVSEDNAEQSAIEAAQSATNAALQLGSYKGDWVSGIYSLGDSVTYDGFIWIAKNTTSIAPVEGENWHKGTGTAASYNAVVDADDQTEDRLLKVGATVKQLDLTNSNIEYVPNATALLDLNFGKQEYKVYSDFDTGSESKSLLDVVDFSRSTTGTGIAGNLSLATASANVPRIVFDPVTGERQGYLSAQSYENELLWSEDLTQAAKTRVTVTLDGNTSVVTEDATLNNKLLIVNGNTITSGTMVTGYVIVEPPYDRNLQLTFSSGSTSGNVYCNFDLSAKTLAYESDSGVGGILETAGGNLLCYVRGELADDSFIGFIPVLIEDAYSSGRFPSYQGDGVSSIRIRACQLTESSFPLPYAKTTTSPVVVDADSMSRTLTGDELNKNSLTLFFHGKYLNEITPLGEFYPCFSIGQDSGNNLSLGRDQNTASLKLRLRVNSAVSDRALGYVGEDYFRVLVIIENGSVIGVAANGIYYNVSSGYDLDFDLDMFSIGKVINGQPKNVICKRAQILNKALSESEAKEMTRL